MSRKLSLDEIASKGILTPGQEYLQDYLAQSADPRVGIYEHSRATSTCAEKVALLAQETGQHWSVDQAVKALYFKGTIKNRDKVEIGYLYAFVTPEFGIPIKTHRHLGKQLPPAKPLPDYMEWGTCTPFIPDWDVSRAGGRVQRIFVHYSPRHDRTIVDMSIGGSGPDAHRRSLWMPYGDVVKLLVKQFGTQVSLTRLDYAVCSKSFKPKPDEVKTYGR